MFYCPGVGPSLRELTSVARWSQEAGLTQPRAPLLANPCILTALHSEEDVGQRHLGPRTVGLRAVALPRGRRGEDPAERGPRHRRPRPGHRRHGRRRRRSVERGRLHRDISLLLSRSRILR